MKRHFYIFISFLKKLFTLANFKKLVILFITGMLFRHIINESVNYYTSIEYITCAFLFCNLNIISTLNHIFKEIVVFLNYKLCRSSTVILHINQCAGVNSYQSANYDSQYYDVQGKISISQPSQLSNYDIDFEARKKITSQLFEEIAQPTRFREVNIPLNNAIGETYLGIRYYDKPCNAHGLYVKYYDLFNQEYVWHVWEKDSNYLKFSDVRYNISSKINVWKEINKTTGTNLSREVRKLLDTDPFHINKSN